MGIKPNVEEFTFVWTVSRYSVAVDSVMQTTMQNKAQKTKPKKDPFLKHFPDAEVKTIVTSTTYNAVKEIHSIIQTMQAPSSNNPHQPAFHPKVQKYIC